jgi:Mg-chelatase subunit ChlD
MILQHPIWLILLIPLVVSLWMWRLPTRFLISLRIVSVTLILLAICGFAIKLPSRAGTIVIVTDRSDSMPPASDASHKEAINLIRTSMGGDQRLAVVSFGRSVLIEQANSSSEFAGVTGEVARDESNLSDALEKALALIPQGSPGRILVLSDGRWTGKDPANAAWRAAARGIAIDYRAMERSAANDIAISQFEAPGTVSPGEAFMINAWIRSPVQQEISYELIRGNERLAAGKRNFSSGLTRLTFRDQAGQPGTYQYILRISGSDRDPVPENNQARLLIGIQGPKPLLCLSPNSNSGLAQLLAAGGLQVKTVLPDAFRWSLEELSNHSALIIENVPADKIGVRGMENITAWVKETGAGLMLTGGKNSYGPGGYYRSQLEPVMPVSMELKREHRKLAMAIVVAMDRSGSMAVPAGGGKTKMDLANLAAVQVLDLMSPMDEFGVIAVDSSPHTVIELKPPANNPELRDEILRIDSGGGGIFIYEALAASAQMLVNANAGTRHIILFADAADSEEPGKYKELIEKCQQAGITISVVGLGKPSDTDAELLRDIARRGSGRIFFTDNPEELPRLFAQDTFVVARSTFVDEATPIQFTGGLVALAGKQFPAPPSVGGYNLCYLRPEANLGGVTVDDYKAPLIASWQAGLGRVLCYTGEADGAYTGEIAKWKDAGELFTSMARWTAGESNTLPGNLLVTQEVRNGLAVVQLHLDPERDSEPFSELPGLSILRGVAGSKPESEKMNLRWTSADTLEAGISLRGDETALSTIDVTGAGRLTLSPVCLPYSPEFKPVEADAGLLALEHLARATDGRERANLASIWKDLPRRPRMLDMAPWLLGIALLTLLLEVLERRTGLLSLRGFKKLRLPTRVAEPSPAVVLKKKSEAPAVAVWKGALKREKADAPKRPEGTPVATEVEPGMDDALVRARRQASARTKLRARPPRE